MDFNGIQRLVAEDMKSVNDTIRRYLHTDVALISEMAHYIINSGGKRLRPMLVVLCARACGYAGDQQHLVAAIVEFIHTATLLHDDVVDDSGMRRGHQTANAVWGNKTTVLVGDFMFSRAFEMMTDVGELRVMDVLAQASSTIAEGEVMQLLNCNDPKTTEEQYMMVIQSKTAKLFEAACQLGAILAGADRQIEQACAAYGKHVGIAFQLKDDLLDYQATSEGMGKNIGDDLAEGKPTLPLIYALKHSDHETAELIREAIVSGGRQHLEQILKAIEVTDAIEYTNGIAHERSRLACRQVDGLPESSYRDALMALTTFAVHRMA